MATSIDFNIPFDAKLLTFGMTKKLDQGGVINFKYNGGEILIRTPMLTAPYGISAPYAMRNNKGGGSAPDAKSGDSNKSSLDMTLSKNDKAAVALNTWITALTDACAAHIKANAAAIYGDDGLKLKKVQAAEAIAAASAGTNKIYRPIKLSEDYDPKLSVKFPVNLEAVELINSKGAKITMLDIGRGSSVSAIFKINGLFINQLLVSVQTVVVAVCAKPTGSVTAATMFSDMLDPDAEPPHSGASGSAGNNKRKRDGDDSAGAA